VGASGIGEEALKDSLRTGISFGLTSAVITTLGLMVGLTSGTHSKVVVLAGILTIAIADAFSDALGIHVSEEAENVHTPAQIWAATAATFLAKFLFAMTFVVPVLLFSLSTAVVVSVIWGMLILTILSYVIAKSQGEPPWKIIGEHLLIGTVVILLTHWTGEWIRRLCI
jgi:VIT1/CCC1 family predicted Fe2+/Mn2+ transporter